MEIYNHIINCDPFCFVRINDGEASAIISETAYASRGDEQSSPELSERLHNILTDSYCSTNLYIGIPCINCYHECFNIVRNELIRSKPYVFIESNVCDANILINNNYDRTFDILANHLTDRHVIIVGNEISINNINKLSRIGIPVHQTYTVSFRINNDEVKKSIFENSFDLFGKHYLIYQ
jgi:hypothetical protein